MAKDDALDLDTKKPGRKSDAPITLDDLEPRARERILIEAKKQLLAEMKDSLQAEAKKAVAGEVREQIITEFIERKKERVLAFLGDVIKCCERYSLYATKEIAERQTLDAVAEKWPGTGMNRRQRMTVAGLFASVGYQMTCREDGSGGCFLKGAIDQRGVVTEFKFEPAQAERTREYKPDAQAGVPRS